MPVSEEPASCELSHVFAPSINSSLLLKRCDASQGPVEMHKTVIECERLYAEVHCHEGALHRKSAFHAFCSEWPYSFFI
jgi:hypothetical protein